MQINRFMWLTGAMTAILKMESNLNFFFERYLFRQIDGNMLIAVGINFQNGLAIKFRPYVGSESSDCRYVSNNICIQWILLWTSNATTKNKIRMLILSPLVVCCNFTVTYSLEEHSRSNWAMRSNERPDEILLCCTHNGEITVWRVRDNR